MPGVTASYPDPNSREGRQISELADSERKDRAALIDTYWKYYAGDHHRPLKVEPGEHDDNVIVNLCAQAIDKAVAFFAPKPPSFSLPGETPQPGDESPAQQALDGFWESNRLEDFIVNVGLSGFVSGHPVVKLLPGNAPGDRPQVALLDSRLVSVFWDASNVRQVLWYRIEWDVDKVGTAHRQDIVPLWLLTETVERDRGDGTFERIEQRPTRPTFDPASTWVIVEYEKRRETQGNWRETARDPWPYPFSPIMDWKNAPLPHDYYGPSDLKHYQINDAVNFVLSNTLRIIKFYAHPRTLIFGANLDQIKSTSIDGVWTLPADARAENLEMQSDLASSMVMAENLRTSFFTLMRVVDWASQKDKVGQLTNFGLRVLFGDMLDQTEGKRRLYGAALCEIGRRALWMMGFPATDAPTADWQDPLPADRLENVNAAAAEQKLGFTSNRTLAAGLGRDYDKEQEQRSEEGTDATDAFGSMLERTSRTGGLDSFMSRLPGAMGANRLPPA